MSRLSAIELSFAYEPGMQVLDRVPFAVEGGELLGIVGPNGAGKSTLLKLLAGLLRPGSGRVELDGEPLAQMTRIETARSIGFLPQTVFPAFRYSVEQVVLMGRYPHLGGLAFEAEHDREIARHALAATGTEKFAERPFDELSGGERRRVLIASVIAQEPRIFLLDEPAASLDLNHQVALYGLLAEQARQGVAVAVVTHDINTALRFCDRLVMLSAGQVVRDGPPEHVVEPGVMREIYGDSVRVTRDPDTGTPLVLPALDAARGEEGRR